MSKKILILGGTGAMGTPLVKLLADEGNEVYVTSRKPKYSDVQNLHYIQGNALDNAFLKTILDNHFDAIFDFMIYYISKVEFKERIERFLNATEQYFYFSSATVYAESDGPITEETMRFVDVHGMDTAMYNRPYVAYKSWQEDVLRDLPNKNWTIIRPYITYAEERIQLGNFEKEVWLYRALKNKTIVFPEEVAECVTTLTYGEDVARALAALVGNEKVYGDTFHITTSQHIKWAEVLEIYLDAIQELKGFRPRVKMPERNVVNSSPDRLQDRIFDNHKIAEITGSDFTDIEVGLKHCVKCFIEEERAFRDIPWRVHGGHDRIAGELMDIEDIPSEAARKEYMMERFGGYDFPEEMDIDQSIYSKWAAFSKEAAFKDWDKVKQVLDECGAKRIGIYALSNFAKQLVSILDLASDAEITYFLYDSDSKKWGKQIGASYVASPEKAYSDELDVLLVTNKRNFNDIYAQYKDLEASGVKILGTKEVTNTFYTR